MDFDESLSSGRWFDDLDPGSWFSDGMPLLLSGPPSTGRSRSHTFDISGTLVARQEWFFGDYYGKGASSEITYGFLSDLIRIRLFNQETLNAIIWGVEIFVGVTEEDSASDFESFDTSADYDELRSFAFTGSVSIPDVQEKFEVLGLDLLLTDTINLLEWVSFGGTPSDDYLPPLKVRFYELILEGTEIEITATINGQTATHTYIVPGDTEMNQMASIAPVNNAAADSGTPGDFSDNTITWECELNGTSMFPSDTWTTTPDSQGSYCNKQTAYAKAIMTMFGSGVAEASGSLLVQPSTLFSVIGSLYAQNQAYPGNLDFDLWAKKTFNGVTWEEDFVTYNLNPTALVSVEQKSFTLAGGTNLTTHTPLEKDETMGVRSHLNTTDLAANGEDDLDWRLMFRGYRWKCGTLTHADLTIDDGSSGTGWSDGANTTHSNTGGAQVAAVSGGTGSLTKTPATDVNCEGHRYLTIRIKSTAAAQTFKVRLVHSDGEEKEYSGVTGLADTYSDVQLDLCFPDSQPSDIDEQESRWPLNDFGGTPTNSGQNWGFNQFDALHIENLTDGQTYSIDSITLSKGTFSQVTFLPAFRPWMEAWTSGTDTTYQKPAAWTNSNGRISDRCFLFKVDAVGPGVSYSWYDIDDSLGQIEGQSGWTVGAGVTPTDGYHGNSLQGFLIEPYIYDYGDPGAWTLCYNRTAQTAADIYAQALWDVVQIYPGAGQVWTSGAYDEATEIAFAKSLRGQAWGLVSNGITEEAESGITVTLKTYPGAVSSGTGASDSQGIYQTGTPWGKQEEHKIHCKDLASAAREIYNRMRHRACFAVVGEGGSIHTCFQPNGLLYSVIATGDKIEVNRFNHDLQMDDTLTLVEGETGIGRAQIAYHPNGYIKVCYDQTDKVYVTENWSSGNNDLWSTPVEISDGKNPAFAIDLKFGIEYVASYITDRWILFRKIPDGDFVEVADIVETATDDSSAGLEVSPDGSNQLVFTYSDSDLTKRKYSMNQGLTWNDL